MTRPNIYNESVIVWFGEIAVDGNDKSIICSRYDIKFLYAVCVTRLKF